MARVGSDRSDALCAFSFPFDSKRRCRACPPKTPSIRRNGGGTSAAGGRQKVDGILWSELSTAESLWPNGNHDGEIRPFRSSRRRGTADDSDWQADRWLHGDVAGRG